MNRENKFYHPFKKNSLFVKPRYGKEPQMVKCLLDRLMEFQ